MTVSLLALGGVVFLSAAAHIVLKRSVSRLAIGYGLRMFVKSMTPGLVAAGVAFLAAPLLYFYALTRLELGFAFIVTALTQGLVIIGGKIFLRERLRPMHITGVCLVLTGVFLWNL